jgi:hypothetical protein
MGSTITHDGILGSYTSTVDTIALALVSYPPIENLEENTNATYINKG